MRLGHLLSRNNAQRITYWDYPSTDEINIASGNLGDVLKTKPALGFLFGSNAIKNLPVDGEPLVDASAWIVGSKSNDTFKTLHNVLNKRLNTSQVLKEREKTAYTTRDY
jgi:hypothetical protein